jgi:hypothetical protein
MTRPIDLLREGRREELWQMCCGFLDLNLEEFMTIQRRLLLEQIELLKNCELGKKLFHGAMPQSIEDFREQVPYTKYSDYIPELVDKKEDTLPAKVAHWVRTSGKTGEYEVKWVPVSEVFAHEYEKAAGALALLATCSKKGDTTKIREHLNMLFTVGPPEYASGIMAYMVQQAINYDMLPANGAELEFEQRIKAGFQEALYNGVEIFGGLPSVLVAVGEQMKSGSGKKNVKKLLSHPRGMLRIMKGMLKSKLARRAMIPSDLWSIRGIVCGGVDGGILKDKIKELWGRYPLEVYGSTEAAISAVQTWDYSAMTFIPTLNFYEFIPESEWYKNQLDPSYKPKSILLDEVKENEVYEIVMTNLHGGAMVRYRIGDMVRITSLRNEKCGIETPQMVFERRADDLIDIFGFGHITERLTWQAIENTGIPYVDWTAKKEVTGDKSTLHIYIELKEDRAIREDTISNAIYDEFLKLDKVHNFNLYKYAYGEAIKRLDFTPVTITLLPRGAFANFIKQRRAQGADLGHLKPPHLNPSKDILDLLGAKRVSVEAVPARNTEEVGIRS